MSTTATGSAPARRWQGLTIQGLRRLILTVLVASVLCFTLGVFALVGRIFDNFGPAVQNDLEWKLVRGAQELAHTADLGLALNDAKIVSRAFAEFAGLDDLVAIVAVGSDGGVVASHGSPPESPAQLISGPPAQVRRAPTYLVAWAASVVEGNAVGRVAMVMSTRRLIQSRALLRRVSLATAAAGAIALLFGVLFVSFFTKTIILRDRQLADYASGLERKVAERTVELASRNAGLGLLLDNAAQGFVAVSLDGSMSDEWSRILVEWFGAPVPGMSFPAYLRTLDEGVAEAFAVGLEAFCDDVLPFELLLDQMPSRLVHRQRTFSMRYSAIRPVDGPERVRLLVVITDITDEMKRESAEREIREMMRLFQGMAVDRAGAEQFFAEATSLVEHLLAGPQAGDEKRLLHTLKGNCALFGVESMSTLCHAIETRLKDESGPIPEADRRRVGAQWRHVCGLVERMRGERRPFIELDERDFRALVQAIDARAAHEQLGALAASWLDEPIAARFTRIADKARYLAGRLGKPGLAVYTDAAGLRLGGERWGDFWAALIHAINNAIDHGIEEPETRIARLKPAGGVLWLTAREEAGTLAISVRDDGRGIDWPALAAAGAARGLPHGSRADLIEVLFAEGVSTRETATSTSGRGVGLAALRAATTALGGSIEVSSEANAGTSLLFRFPRAAGSTPEMGEADLPPRGAESALAPRERATLNPGS
jgi:two-component system chemotaxis sensor kinase CheA